MDKIESSINCNICKIRKVKCGRELPACSYCSERGIACTYSEKIRRRGANEVGLTSFIGKIKVGFSFQSCKLTSRYGKNNKIVAGKNILFQPILEPTNSVNKCLQGVVTKIQSNNTQKIQTHFILTLSTQIMDYDKELLPQIGFLVNKLEFGMLEKSLKFSIHMNQEWIAELFSPSFEEKCISGYFQSFHPMVTYLSKFKFYTNSNATCPVLKSIIILAGYSSFGKKSPELLKYLKHLAIVQLKKNIFNIRVSICQAIFIFSCYLLLQGLGKQSLEYFHQAYLMASALGIHVDMPGLNEMDKDERRCIRFASLRHDYHLCGNAGIQPYYLFSTPTWKPLNPIYQTNPYSKDPNEFLVAECICLNIMCQCTYWIVSVYLMNKFSSPALINPLTISENNTRVIYIFQNLLNCSLVRILDLYLGLSGRCKNLGELQIVKNFAKIHVRQYHKIRIILYSQFSPLNPTLELNQNTRKQLWSANYLYRSSFDVNPLHLLMTYHNLCSLSLLYIKLILTYNHASQIKELFIGRLKQVYKLFNSLRSKYNMPDDLIEAVDIIIDHYKIKV